MCICSAITGEISWNLEGSGEGLFNIWEIKSLICNLQFKNIPDKLNAFVLLRL